MRLICFLIWTVSLIVRREIGYSAYLFETEQPPVWKVRVETAVRKPVLDKFLLDCLSLDGNAFIILLDSRAIPVKYRSGTPHLVELSVSVRVIDPAA